MDRILNFRKLADGELNNDGKQIKLIYRSADPSLASLLDKEELVKLGIKSIIDLRSEEEISVNPLINDERLTVKWIDIIGNGTQNKVEKFGMEELNDLMIGLYKTDFVQTEGFKQEFKYIDSLNGDGFLFHCTAGKDRTGITGIVLMQILGFTKEQIVTEYLTIDEKLVDSIINRFLGAVGEADPIHNDSIRAVASVKEEFINSFFGQVEKEYGTLDNFINTKLQITDEMKQSLRQNYLV